MVYSVSISEDGKNYRSVFNGIAASIQVAELPPNKSVSVSEDGNNYRSVFNGIAASIQVADLEKKGNMTLYVSKDGTAFQPNPIYNVATNYYINFPVTGSGNKVVYVSTDGASFQPNPIYNDAAKNFFFQLAPVTQPGIQLPNDGRPQPEKNANKDAKTWKTAQMTDDPALWKVVDDKNINVADQFHSQANAQQYIDYYKSTYQKSDTTGTLGPAEGKDYWTSIGVLDTGRTFRTHGDEHCPWDSRLYFPRTEQNPDNFIDGKGNIILSGEGSSRFFILGKWKNMRMECDLVPTNLMDNMSLNGRSRHNIKCKFGGYHLSFSVDDNEDLYGKKEGGPGYSHGIYSPRLGINRKEFEQRIDGIPAGKKVRLALEVEDDGSKVTVKGFVDKYDGKGFVQSHEYVDDGHCYDEKKWEKKDLDALKDCGVNRDDINKPYLEAGNMVWFRANHHEEEDPIRQQNPRIKDIYVSNIIVKEL
jgi:hypothetical protein